MTPGVIDGRVFLVLVVIIGVLLWRAFGRRS